MKLVKIWNAKFSVLELALTTLAIATAVVVVLANV